MGGYLGVQQGSKFPPCFVHLTYRPESPAAEVTKVALVGKGLTFDRWVGAVGAHLLSLCLVPNPSSVPSAYACHTVLNACILLLLLL